MERDVEKGEITEKNNLTSANFIGDSNSNIFLKVDYFVNIRHLWQAVTIIFKA